MHVYSVYFIFFAASRALSLLKEICNCVLSLSYHSLFMFLMCCTEWNGLKWCEKIIYFIVGWMWKDQLFL